MQFKPMLFKHQLYIKTLKRADQVKCISKLKQLLCCYFYGNNNKRRTYKKT